MELSNRRSKKRFGRLISLSALSCLSLVPAVAAPGDKVTAFVGGRIIDGTGKPALEKATLLIRGDRIEAVGKNVKVPAGAIRINASGKTIIPGLINAHGHLDRPDQLGMYLRDGITTIFSLGDECFDLRPEPTPLEMRLKQGPCSNELDLRKQAREAPIGTMPHVYAAGPVINVKTAADARQAVDDLIAHYKPDIVKFREGDITATPRIGPEAYGALIDEAHKLHYRVAVHTVRLDDAKGVLKAGADYLAHGVRDQDVDAEFIELMKKRNIYYCPTMTRDLSAFVYEETPVFFHDPFFLKEAPPAEVRSFEDPEKQAALKKNKNAQWYKDHFDIALHNLKTVSDAGIGIAMGTDSGGAPGRFQGYFEHLEMEYEAKAGLTPMQVLVSATGGAAKAVGIYDKIGTLEANKAADFVVLTANPLEDIKNTRSIESVWISGTRVAAKDGAGK